MRTFASVVAFGLLVIAFFAYVERVLVPTLKPGDIAVMDNLYQGALIMTN